MKTNRTLKSIWSLMNCNVNQQKLKTIIKCVCKINVFVRIWYFQWNSIKNLGRTTNLQLSVLCMRTITHVTSWLKTLLHTKLYNPTRLIHKTRRQKRSNASKTKYWRSRTKFSHFFGDGLEDVCSTKETWRRSPVLAFSGRPIARSRNTLTYLFTDLLTARLR